MDVLGRYTAWFSKSVPENVPSIWIENGGRIGDRGTANFLFSTDASYPDTVPLFSDSRLSVFHPDLVGEWLKANDMRKIPVGRYEIFPSHVVSRVQESNVDMGELLKYSSVIDRDASTQKSAEGLRLAALIAMLWAQQPVHSQDIPRVDGPLHRVSLARGHLKVTLTDQSGLETE